MLGAKNLNSPTLGRHISILRQHLTDNTKFYAPFIISFSIAWNTKYNHTGKRPVQSPFDRMLGFKNCEFRVKLTYVHVGIIKICP